MAFNVSTGRNKIINFYNGGAYVTAGQVDIDLKSRINTKQLYDTGRHLAGQIIFYNLSYVTQN